MNLEEKAKELQREYMREWRQRNKDKVKQYRERYWLKKAKQLEKKENGGM